MQRITKADCERLVVILNKRTGLMFAIDSGNNKRRRLIQHTANGGERNISPTLTPDPLYTWIHAYMDGIELRDKMRDALMVLTTTPSIRAWLEVNDPKALEQAEAAFK